MCLTITHTTPFALPFTKNQQKVDHNSTLGYLMKKIKIKLPLISFDTQNTNKTVNSTRS